jgi:hypothetical protein
VDRVSELLGEFASGSLRVDIHREHGTIMDPCNYEPGNMNCPAILPMPKEEYLPPYDVSEPDLGYYKPSENAIYLGTGYYKRNPKACYGSLMDHAADVTLIHELAHWASFELLSTDEKKAFSNPDEVQITGLIERIAYETELQYIKDMLDRISKFNPQEIALRKKQLLKHQRICKGELEKIRKRSNLAEIE